MRFTPASGTGGEQKCDVHETLISVVSCRHCGALSLTRVLPAENFSAGGPSVIGEMTATSTDCLRLQ